MSADDVYEAHATLIAPEDPSGAKGALAHHQAPLPGNPAQLYIASLHTQQSRRAGVGGLCRLVELLNKPGMPEPEWWEFPWHRIGPREATAAHALLEARYEPATVRLTLCVLRGVLRQCWRLRLIDAEHHQRTIDLPKVTAESAPAGRMLQLEEIQKLTAYLRTLPKPFGTMVSALFAVALGGGLRRAELAGLEVDALSSDDKTIRVLGKGRRERIQALPTWAGARLRAWVEARRDYKSPTMFVWARGRRLIDKPLNLWAVWCIITTTGRAAGLESFSPHDLRRTFASRMLDASDLSITQKAMAHKSASTTVRYDRRDASRVSDAVESLEGLGFESSGFQTKQKEKVMPKVVREMKPEKPTGLTTLGEAVKAKGPKLSKLVVDGQELVQRGRVVGPPRYRRNGLPLDAVWAQATALKFVQQGKTHEFVRALLTKLGVRRGDGAELEVADIGRLL